ncbi:MAG: hypothetical protein AABZ31_14740 [Bdellovibrionota bacterium]
MSKDKRVANRKDIDFIKVNDLTAVMDYSVIAQTGQIINASASGFLLQIDRKDILPPGLKENLTLDSTLGQQVVLYLPQMNLDLDGTITRASHMGRGRFVVAIDFSSEVPVYWRDCLIDLLPAPGEIEYSEEEE